MAVPSPLDLGVRTRDPYPVVTLSITKLAAELGVRSDTLRYHERSGLIPSAGRTEGGCRLYEDAVADRVKFDCRGVASTPGECGLDHSDRALALVRSW